MPTFRSRRPAIPRLPQPGPNSGLSSATITAFLTGRGFGGEQLPFAETLACKKCLFRALSLAPFLLKAGRFQTGRSEKVRVMATNRGRLAPAHALSQSVLGRQTEKVESLYTIGKKLGQGQFGITYLATDKATGKEYACKTIAKKKLLTVEDVEDVKREVAIMHHLAGYTNIVNIRGAYEDPFAVHIVMELCSGGELFDRIIAKGHFSERQAASLAKTIAQVVEICHSLGVMHRDLKPENFLISDRSEDGVLKATDFGLSVFFKPGEILTDVVGSPYYVAPEVLRRRYGKEADIWSMGVIVYILLSGVPPFWAETEQGIFEAVLRGELDFESEPWPSISKEAKELIRHMCHPNPAKRLTAYEVLCHPWVAKDGVAPDKPLDTMVLSRMKTFSAMNKLKKMALRVIAENMSEEEISGLKEMFKSMDTDNSGTITFDELKSGLRRAGSTLNDSEIQELMDAADFDGNGMIDYQEFLAATLHLNKIEREETLFAAFSHFDKDKSGFISIDELQVACREYGFEEDSVMETMRDVDTNNDGIIDYNEFVAMMRAGNGGIGRRSLTGSWTSGNLFGNLKKPVPKDGAPPS